MPPVLNRSGSFRVRTPNCSSTPTCILTRRMATFTQWRTTLGTVLRSFLRTHLEMLLPSGNVAPKRILKGPHTLIVGNKPPVAIDPLRNLLVVNLNNAFLIFDRTASGDAAPKAIIRGPRSQVASTGNFRVYPPTGMIIDRCSGESVCAWSINDNGDVPPRWKIPVKQITGYRISGLALDPAP